MNQKGFAPILILIIVVVLASGGYLVYKQYYKSSPQAQPTIQSSPTPNTSTPSATLKQSPKSSNSVKKNSPTPSPTPKVNTPSLSNPTSSPTNSPTPSPTPTPSIGYTFSQDSVTMTVKNDGSENLAYTFTSIGSTSYSFTGGPNYQGGIVWTAASGANHVGATTQQKLVVYQNVLPGVYTGTATFTDHTKGIEKSFPISITVTN